MKDRTHRVMTLPAREMILLNCLLLLLLPIRCRVLLGCRKGWPQQRLAAATRPTRRSIIIPFLQRMALSSVSGRACPANTRRTASIHPAFLSGRRALLIKWLPPSSPAASRLAFWNPEARILCNQKNRSHCEIALKRAMGSTFRSTSLQIR